MCRVGVPVAPVVHAPDLRIVNVPDQLPTQPVAEGLEQAYGFEPSPYTAPYVVETAESARRRDRFRAEAAALESPTTTPYETVTPPAKPRGAAGAPRLIEGRTVSW